MPGTVGPTLAYMVRMRIAPLALLALLGVMACAAPAAEEDDGEAPVAGVVAPNVTVVDRTLADDIEVAPDRVALPLPGASAYRELAAGTVIVGERGEREDTKNPDGFLRRVRSVRVVGATLEIETEDATMADAIIDGSVVTSTSRLGEPSTSSTRSVRPLVTKAFQGIDQDFSGRSIYRHTEKVGATSVEETVTLKRAHLVAKPAMNLDLRIRRGRVQRFEATVQSTLDAELDLEAVVSANGGIDAAALRAHPRSAKVVLLETPRLPLPTIFIGVVPIVTSVQFTVSLDCSMTFAGTITANAGAKTNAFVRLGATYEDGAWKPPITSQLDIEPHFTMTGNGALEARCALDAEAHVRAFGVGGVALGVGPYVSLGVEGPSPDLSWQLRPGARAHMSGYASLFGKTLGSFDRELYDWQSPRVIRGSVPVTQPSP